MGYLDRLDKCDWPTATLREWPRYANALDFRFPIPDSRFPIPDSRFPTPDSRLPTPDSRLPTPNSRFPIPEPDVKNLPL
ncbi:MULTISPECIES: hypothetical protein [unclassified Moorena]|uniref:hypothetical protein n=1 Tax=unclassified Moorena TaxID=2683338 RepID=UPI0013C5A0AD|nr:MULTISPECIES: hypothetical protein [unclassified Moorena]NEO22356.1 hypothetical protein [Moorena sp. SIO4A5]NEQ58417.1 hypothetical protein [Moorena sp. SIO4A1]